MRKHARMCQINERVNQPCAALVDFVFAQHMSTNQSNIMSIFLILPVHRPKCCKIVPDWLFDFHQKQSCKYPHSSKSSSASFLLLPDYSSASCGALETYLRLPAETSRLSCVANQSVCTKQAGLYAARRTLDGCRSAGSTCDEHAVRTV